MSHLTAIFSHFKTYKKQIIFFGVALFLSVGFYIQAGKELSLNANKGLTIGKLTRIRSGSKARRYFEFQYIVNGVWIDGQDPDDATWPVYVREGKAMLGQWYLVVYDKTDVEYSKIQITEEPLSKDTVDAYLKRQF